MIAKNLTLNHFIFRVTAGDITKHTVAGMRTYRDNGTDWIEITTGPNQLKSVENAVWAESKYSSKFYYDFDEAQKEQSRLRLVDIELAAANLAKAQDSYQELITKYFNKPLSNPFQDEE